VDSADEWYTLPVLTGRLIRLEPLAVEHAAGYLAAAGTGPDAEELFRWLSPPGGARRQPVSLDDARRHIIAALAARARSERFPYAQLDVATGEVAGTTSLYEVDPKARALAIGHTWLGKRWWRSGHNTEAKLLLLTYAFETLGAVRVVWHTDILNVRSQQAIERLGATKEGVLRKHRLRFDGSWRDTVQYAMTDDDWPSARDRLAGRLAAG
jgi:RimJ/RimL family protein N-acetyltransferase